MSKQINETAELNISAEKDRPNHLIAELKDEDNRTFNELREMAVAATLNVSLPGLQITNMMDRTAAGASAGVVESEKDATRIGNDEIANKDQNSTGVDWIDRLMSSKLHNLDTDPATAIKRERQFGHTSPDAPSTGHRTITIKTPEDAATTLPRRLKETPEDVANRQDQQPARPIEDTGKHRQEQQFEHNENHPGFPPSEPLNDQSRQEAEVKLLTKLSSLTNGPALKRLVQRLLTVPVPADNKIDIDDRKDRVPLPHVMA